MDLIKILSAPLIGAIIGYCTNYIAVKMLFRPLKPVKVWGKTLPFTPGIIPKRKPALARAIGQAVGTSLVGEEEIAAALSSETMKQAVVDGIVCALETAVKENTVKETAGLFLEDAQYEQKKEKAAEAVAGKIADGIASIDFTEVIVREGTAAIRDKGGMLAMFLNEDTIRGFAGPIGSRAQDYLQGEGRDYINEKVKEEFDLAENKTVAALLGEEDFSGLHEKVGILYDSIVSKEAKNIGSAFDICGIVETKIMEMDVRELEQLIMSVMKNELGMIVNLGALIGFLLGLFNLLF